MGIEVALSVIQTLLTAFQSFDQLTELSSIFSYKPQLDQLRGTFARIQAVLVDADTKVELSQEEKVYIEELKDALYEADDLFDEFLTLVQRKELTKGFKQRYFSVFKKLESALKMSQKVKKIKSKLDAIAYNNQLINFKYDPEPIKKRRPETCSYVHAVEIIGRDADLEKIVGILLRSDVQQDVSFVSIVGIGGLGKTALAQLVFNDQRIIDAFPLKLWTCISDLGQGQLDILGILRKILASITGEKNEGATMDRVQNDIRAKLTANRYLLVLDDVWTEDREQWSKLTSFLMGGQKGSKILVTTRSSNTARIMGYGSVHELQGLSEKDSWRLFEVMAFGYEQLNLSADFLDVVQDIIVRCANVPLAIRVMGSLLYGQDRREWLLIQKHGLANLEANKDGIKPILKLSYQQLHYSLKSCFGYCAIFPKDYVMQKETLLRLWMAQGYIPLDNQRNVEDVAEEYFMVLLRRCFFQDIVEDEYGDIQSCKVHDLMHDVAQEIAGKDICMSDTFSGNMDKRVRHVHLTSSQPTEYTFAKSSIRSYLQGGGLFEHTKMDKHLLDTLLGKCKYLRVLSLMRLDMRSLPSSIGDLLHLRYLNLSYNRHLELLPKQITKMYNLQTLILRDCYSLKKLPKDMSKLVKLRVLDIYECQKLTCMPIDIGKLDCLQELTMFVVGEVDSTWDKFLKSLEDLKALRNLKGFLEIKIVDWKNIIVEEDSKGGYLQNKEHLNHLKLNFSSWEGRVENDEALIKELQPHSNVKRLDMSYYKGMGTPEWWQEVNLVNIVTLRLFICPNLQCLGCIGKLCHLKHLDLDSLQNLEFLVDKDTGGVCNAVTGLRSSRVLEFSFFPSLKTLELSCLPNLKGVWMGDNDQPLQLPLLTYLWISSCPDLIAILECPTLEYFKVVGVHEKLGLIIKSRRKDGEERGDERDKEDEPTMLTTHNSVKLREVVIDNMKWLNSLQQLEAFQCVHSLVIMHDDELESLEEGGGLFSSCSSSLRSLEILNCLNLRRLTGGLEYLGALEALDLSSCPRLMLSEEEDREEGSGIPWKSLNHSLRTLKLGDFPQLMNLPNWIQNLTTLQSLEICGCKELKSLPNWMSNLTSLRELRLMACSEALEERCQDFIGEDWPHIKHISSIVIKDSYF